MVSFGLQLVSEDGNNVKRQHPLTESDMEELQVCVIFFICHFLCLQHNSSLETAKFGHLLCCIAVL